MSMRRRIILAGGGVGAVVAIALGWWLGSPLFVSNVVDEAFPFEMPESAAMDSMPAEEKQQLKAEFDAAMPSSRDHRIAQSRRSGAGPGTGDGRGREDAGHGDGRADAGRSGGGGSCRNARRDAGRNRGCHSNTGAYGNA